MFLLNFRTIPQMWTIIVFHFMLSLQPVFTLTMTTNSIISSLQANILDPFVVVLLEPSLFPCLGLVLAKYRLHR